MMPPEFLLRGTKVLSITKGTADNLCYCICTSINLRKMKLLDHVKQSIVDYPTLYCADNFDISMFYVLHDIFITLGNGFEWAYTQIPEEGGYLIEPTIKEVDDQRERIFDPSYAKVEFTDEAKLKKALSNEAIYYGIPNFTLEEQAIILNARFPSTKALRMTSNNYRGYYKPLFESEISDLQKKFAFKCQRHTTYCNPYPNFQKKFSCFWSIDPKLIQSDWKQAGIKHLTYWRDWFTNPSLYVSHPYHPDNTKDINTKVAEEFWISTLKTSQEFIQDTLIRLGSV